MRISGYENISVSFFKSQPLQNIGKTKAANQGAGSVPEDRDVVTISFLGKMNNSRLKDLMDQKQSLLERKNELLNSVSERGGDVKSIENILDSYEEHLKELEQQISQELTRQNREQEEKPQPSKKGKPKTKQELEQERIAGLVDLSAGMAQARTIQASRTQAEGEARVLESEIKMDKGRGGDSEITARKGEKLAQLQQKAAELASKAGEASGEIISKINEGYEQVRQEREKPQEGQDSQPDSIYGSKEPDVERGSKIV